MSERTPAGGSGSGRRGRDAPDWLEHSGSSVFGSPAGEPAPQDDPAERPGDPWRERRRRAAPWAAGNAGPAAAAPTRHDAGWDDPRATRRSEPGWDDPRGAPPADPGWDDPRTATRVWPGGGPGADPYGNPRGGPPPSAPPRSRRPAPVPGPAADRRSARSAAAGGTPRRGGRGDDGDGRGGGGLRSPIGLGAVVGGLGALAFLAALLVLPWFSAGGEDRTLSDLRSAFEVPATDPNDLPGAGDPTASTLPEGIPTPDDVADAVEEEARDTATTAMAGAIDDGKARYLELYAEVLWLPIAAVVAVAAVVSTVLAPRSMALSLLLGVRRIAGAAVVMAGLAHAAALWVVFTGDGAPPPAVGVWIGVGGLAAVFVGCIIGPRD